jgi:hypothetical protein
VSRKTPLSCANATRLCSECSPNKRRSPNKEGSCVLPSRGSRGTCRLRRRAVQKVSIQRLAVDRLLSPSHLPPSPASPTGYPHPPHHDPSPSALGRRLASDRRLRRGHHPDRMRPIRHLPDCDCFGLESELVWRLHLDRYRCIVHIACSASESCQLTRGCSVRQELRVRTCVLFRRVRDFLLKSAPHRGLFGSLSNLASLHLRSSN